MDVLFVRLIKVLTFLCCLCTIAEANNYGVCVNPSCSEPVGEGLTIQGYNAPDNSRISFGPNEKFTIFVKQAGPRKDLLGIMIRGLKGYAPSNLVKEEKTFVASRLLVPAKVDFLVTEYSSNSMVNQIQSSSQWSHQDGQSFSHTDGSFQSGEQSASQFTHQDTQSHMSHTDNTFQGHASSQWPKQEVQFIMPSSQENVQSGEQYIRSDYDYYYYSGHPGASHSPQYHYSSSQFYGSSDEIHTPFDYHSEISSNLEPSVQVRVQVQTNAEHLAGSQRHTHDRIHQPLISDYAHQDSQWRNAPLESSFTGHWQDNSLHAHHFQNPPNSLEHVRNLDHELKSPSIPSQTSEFQTKALNSEMNSKQFVDGSNQHPSSAFNTLQNEGHQDVFDTLVMLKEQGYDFNDYSDLLQADQTLQNDLNPSQYAQSTKNSNGAGDGHLSSSRFESSNEQIPKYSSSGENINPSLPSAVNVDEESSETSKPLDHHEISTSGYRDATKSVVMDFKEKNPEESDLDKDDEVELDGEIDVEEEDDGVEDLTPSEDGDVEEEDQAPHSDLQQKETVTLTQSDAETNKLNVLDVSSVSQPEVVSTHVQEPSFTSDSYRSFDKSLNKPDIIPPTYDKKTSDYKEIVTENVPTDSDLKSLGEKNLDDDIAGSSSLGVTSEMQSDSLFVSKTATDFFESSKSSLIPNNSKSENTDTTTESLAEMLPDTDQFTKVESELSNTGVFSFDKAEETLSIENFNEAENISGEEQETDLYKILNISELSESEKVGYVPYQIRNLKEENGSQDNPNAESDEETEENAPYVEFDFYGSVENSLEGIRSFLELLLSWVPEPLYSIIMDVQKSGISPRVPVFTIISSIPCILLIITVVYIKEKSKEKKLTTLLALSEKNVYMLTAEKNILEEKIEKTAEELKSSSSTLDTERSTYEALKLEVENLKQKVQKTSQELESCLEEIDTLKEREKEYAELVSDHEKAHLELREEKSQVENKILELEEAISSLNSDIIEKDFAIDELQKEKLEFLQSSKDYEEKLSQLQQNCNQLLKEAEVWNMRVNELTSKFSEISSAKDELENSLKLKDSEIESLTHLVTTLKSYEELEITDGDETKSNEEKLSDLLNSSSILIKLQNQEEENKALVEKLSGEKSKILEMEVELLETKSDCDKLKLSYNQALQDKAEAQTKLDVLTNYFKDKEIQMQKQIGAQEAVREKREKDADSAERRICLIEQENSSYKYQVASMKQEMEETERNLKSQIATQEKKAHENWIAARAAERKLEDMKQEVTQLRQRLTLLEREQENWTNSSRDEIIRPVPKRISGINDESSSQDMNNSMDLRHNIFPPPPPHPMMLPLDRPLPPLPPPHHLPPFLPPPPPMEGQFRMQPWPHHSMPGSDYRITPPDFGRGRASTPPRGHHSAIVDGDMVPMQSSPLGGEMRDSRNSTPPHSLPDFHDIPPPPRPFFPPPGAHPRFPLPPPFRRDLNQGPRKTDNPSDHSSTQSSALQDNWPHSNSRV